MAKYGCNWREHIGEALPKVGSRVIIIYDEGMGYAIEQDMPDGSYSLVWLVIPSLKQARALCKNNGWVIISRA